MKDEAHSAVDPFNRDVAANAGYLYTTNASLSSQLSNRRITDAALAAESFHGKRVIDIGCGDGTYTIDLFNRGQPASICGVDPAHEAVGVARQKVSDPNITFTVESAYELPYAANSFDIAHLRGVLHHMDRPVDALREALRVAPLILVIESNGYSPVLKVLERVSPYHLEHQEKSYGASTLDRWVRDLGGEVQSRTWIGLVPFFCPAWMARSLKAVEPWVEGLPLLRAVACAQYVMVATRRDGSPTRNS